ncbi:Ribosomal protein [Trema orientale]|uniref:Ribosomal protein n=1 Tax=Trema orientale TaxID=63057 RepID=A0A2P5FY94_TREOI|nr:Ribosomal protein [Trema orientale]
MARWWRSGAGGLRVLTTNSPTSSSKAASYHTIQAIPRECTGTRVAARDRAQGRIPAVVFSHNLLEKDPNSRSASKKHLLTTESKQIQSIVRSVKLPFFCSTRFPLQIRAGSGSSVLLESGNIHRDEKTGKILNLVFVWAEEGSDLKVNVPIVFKGEDVSPGLKKGGNLNRIRTSLKYLCPAEHIPPKVEVDVSNLDIGDRIFMRDVEVHPSLKLLSKNEDIPICKIVATELENPESAGV